ncbi:hypothetical protein BJV74DRAFT_877811 [Russula compacta]|nr:hypothetical protein BJV74DRAFT_877811 [Russula compacta]
MCFLKCKSGHGLMQHRLSAHRQFTLESDDDCRQTSTFQYHPYLNGIDVLSPQFWIPCNLNGNFLPPHTPPPPHVPAGGALLNPWHPFGSWTEFDFTHYHFVEVQSSEGNINKALNMWATTVMEFGHNALWKNATQLYQTINNIRHGDMLWKLYHVRYKGPLPAGMPPKWMTELYDLCMRDSCQVLHHQLATSDFTDKIDVTPYQQFDSEGKWSWSNLMSADWAWKQADIIAEDQATHGAMFVPIVVGSDKTTVSIAIGHQQYHPIYMSPGNVTNVAWQAHEVIKCPDGHFCHAIYGLGPYIADYPEQVWLAAIVQGWCLKCNAPPNDLDHKGAHWRTQVKTDFLISAWDPGTLWTDFGVHADIILHFPFTQDFPQADIHKLLSVDLLHQVIKGTFKDHLVMWALMKVYLAAITGHVPSEMAFVGMARQHSLKHYICSIQLFGSLNGLCSSITECSSHFKALVQMLWTICQLDKLVAARCVHTELGMMDGMTTSYAAMILRGEQPQPRVPAAVDKDEDDDNGPVSGPKSLSSVELAQTTTLQRFLYDQIHSNSNISSADIDIEQCPNFTGWIYVYHLAIACFFAPSDLCGTGGMYHECICSNPNWHGEYAHHDTMFILTDNVPDDDTGMWVVQPEFAVIHLNSVARAAHLLPVYVLVLVGLSTCLDLGQLASLLTS